MEDEFRGDDFYRLITMVAMPATKESGGRRRTLINFFKRSSDARIARWVFIKLSRGEDIDKRVARIEEALNKFNRQLQFKARAEVLVVPDCDWARRYRLVVADLSQKNIIRLGGGAQKIAA